MSIKWENINMTQAVFTIKDHSDITKTISYLHSNYTRSVDEGKPLVVTIKPETKDRTKDQNRLYWLQLHFVEKQTGQDADSLHEIVKGKFVTKILMRDREGFAEMVEAIRHLKAIGSKDYESIAAGVYKLISTTILDTKQFTDYLKLVEAYMLSELGIMVPVPDDLKYLIQ